MFWDLKQRIFMSIDWTAYDKDNRMHGMCWYCCITCANFNTCDKSYSRNKRLPCVDIWGAKKWLISVVFTFTIHSPYFILRCLGSVVSDVLSQMSASCHCLFTGVACGVHCLLRDARIFPPICKLWVLVFDLPIGPNWPFEPWTSNAPAWLNSGW